MIDADKIKKIAKEVAENFNGSKPTSYEMNIFIINKLMDIEKTMVVRSECDRRHEGLSNNNKQIFTWVLSVIAILIAIVSVIRGGI